MHFVEDLSKPGRALLQVGTTDQQRTMFYSIWDMAESGVQVERWRRDIPEPLSWAEGEYYALQRGLQATVLEGYSEVKILVNAPPICIHLEVGTTPTSRFEPYFDAVEKELDEFEYVEYRPYYHIETQPYC